MIKRGDSKIGDNPLKSKVIKAQVLLQLIKYIFINFYKMKMSYLLPKGPQKKKTHHIIFLI